MRYLGIDYGARKVGLALSDENGTMGFPHGILKNAPALLPTLLALIAKEKIGAVVMGESKGLDGSDNGVAAAARALAAQLGAGAGVPVYFEDERFTSAEARRQFAPAEKSRKPARRAPVDASAAALILTNFLTRQKSG